MIANSARPNMTSKRQTGLWQSRKAARFDMVSFHCQQAAEKYLKCLLTNLGIQTPRTHDLRMLVSLIPG
jgi:HEPN domain-containing protein